MIDARRALAASAAVVLALGVAACGGGGGGNGPGSTELNLVIGNALPLSGTSKSLGLSGEKASRLALKRIDDAVGSVGAEHTVKLVNRDASTGAVALESTKALVDTDNASCLTGPWSSDAVALTAQDVAIPAEVLQISPVAMGRDVAELSDHDLVVSTALPVSLEGEALAKAIEEDLGGTQGHTVNLAASANDYGMTVSQDFIEAWQDQDGTVGTQTVLAPPPPPATQAPRITSGSPNAIVLVDDATDFPQLAQTLSSAASWNPGTAWGSDQLVDPGLPMELGAEAVEGMRALAPAAPAANEPAAAFAADFKSSAPRAVDLAPYAAQQFDATILCYLAAVAAGSTDGQEMADELIDITAPGGTEYSWQQLPEAIRALEDGEDIDYTGASGPLDMDVAGNPTKGVFDVYQYSSGGLEQVGEVPVEKPNPATP